jgi:hypothetical protein
MFPIRILHTDYPKYLEVFNNTNYTLGKKHRGKKLSWIFTNDINYFNWYMNTSNCDNYKNIIFKYFTSVKRYLEHRHSHGIMGRPKNPKYSYDGLNFSTKEGLSFFLNKWLASSYDGYEVKAKWVKEFLNRKNDINFTNKRVMVRYDNINKRFSFKLEVVLLYDYKIMRKSKQSVKRKYTTISSNLNKSTPTVNTKKVKKT